MRWTSDTLIASVGFSEWPDGSEASIDRAIRWQHYHRIWYKPPGFWREDMLLGESEYSRSVLTPLETAVFVSSRNEIMRGTFDEYGTSLPTLTHRIAALENISTPFLGSGWNVQLLTDVVRTGRAAVAGEAKIARDVSGSLRPIDRWQFVLDGVSGIALDAIGYARGRAIVQYHIAEIRTGARIDASVFSLIGADLRRSPAPAPQD